MPIRGSVVCSDDGDYHGDERGRITVVCSDDGDYHGDERGRITIVNRGDVGRWDSDGGDEDRREKGEKGGEVEGGELV
jgi:hypothetical protein